MNKKHDRKGRTYSIWLMPDGKCASSVSKIINDISKKYNTPIFKPHVTLIGDCEKEKWDMLYFIFKKEKIDNDSLLFGNINDRLNNNNILKFY